MASQQGGGSGGTQDGSETDNESRDSPKFSQRHAVSPWALRVQKDIADFFADPPPGIFIAPEESDIANVHVLMVGSQGTPFEGGFFRLRITFPINYPMSPPEATFLTTDAGRVSFNQHISPSGYICLDILNSHGLQSWSPAQSLSSVLISLQSLLNQNSDAQSNRDSTSSEKTKLLHETIRVAVCDAVEDCLRDNSSFPPVFRDTVVNMFEQDYSKHEDAVRAHLHLSGTVMGNPLFGPSRMYQFETLLSRLRDLKKRVTKKRQEAADAAVVAASALSGSTP